MNDNNPSQFGSSHQYQNNTILGGNVQFGNSYTYWGPDPQIQRNRQVLESLRFREIYLRENQISDAHHKTFQWIYEKEVKRPWDGFAEWLKNGQKVYWVAGKPGSGKSTLVKFIASNNLTRELLKATNEEVEPLILTFFFWKAGSEIQRSLSGCLASILHQVLDVDPIFITKLHEVNQNLHRKRSVEDWSTTELKKALLYCLSLIQRSCCLFLDGLDEYETGSDVVELVNLAVQLNELQNVKVCVSSRQEPELSALLAGNPMLKLQDLTRHDILSLTQERLEKELKHVKFMNTDRRRNQELVHDLVDKAEGVFLWVIVAIKYLATGLRKNDDFDILQKRLDMLSPEMKTLYEQMWERLNEDKQLYREEAAIYFYFAKQNPVQLLFYTLASNEKLRQSCMNSRRLLDYSLLLEVKEACEDQAARIRSRCAGFLDIISDPDYELSSDQHRAKFRKVEPFRQFTTERTHLHSGRYYDDFQDMSGLCTCRAYPWPSSYEERFAIQAQLCDIFINRKVSFIHRTAVDFLTDTVEGQVICQINSRNQANALSSWLKALGAAVNCGLYCAEASEWRQILDICYDADIPETELIHFREDAERLMLKHSEQLLFFPPCLYGSNHWFYVQSQNPTDDTFDQHYDLDYSGSMASLHCLEPILRFISSAPETITPYYKGYLLICAARSRRFAKTARKLKVMYELLGCGADLLTPHTIQGLEWITFRSPIAQCWLTLLDMISRRCVAADDLMMHNLVNALTNTEIPHGFEVLFRVGTEFKRGYIDILVTGLHGGQNAEALNTDEQRDRASWIMMVADIFGLCRLVARMLKSPENLPHDKFRLSEWARVITVKHVLLSDVVTPKHEDAVRIMDALQEDLEKATTCSYMEQKAFRTAVALEYLLEDNYDVLNDQPEPEDEFVSKFILIPDDDTAVEDLFLVNPDPYEHINMENWFERGELRDWHERRRRTVSMEKGT